MVVWQVVHKISSSKYICDDIAVMAEGGELEEQSSFPQVWRYSPKNQPLQNQNTRNISHHPNRAVTNTANVDNQAAPPTFICFHHLRIGQANHILASHIQYYTINTTCSAIPLLWALTHTATPKTWTTQKIILSFLYMHLLINGIYICDWLCKNQPLTHKIEIEFYWLSL